MSLARFSVNNRVLVNMLMLVILMAGGIFAFTLVREFFPESRPDKVMITAEDVRQALKAPVEEIISHLLRTLEMTPAALAEDVMRDGILLAGGGALLHGLDKRINTATDLPVKICQDPKMAVIKGLEKLLSERVAARG